MDERMRGLGKRPYFAILGRLWPGVVGTLPGLLDAPELSAIVNVASHTTLVNSSITTQ